MRLAPSVRYRSVCDEGVLVEFERSRVVVVNGTGLFLVERLQQGDMAEGLAEALVEVFEVSAEAARRDVAAFLSQMAQEGLLEEAP